MSLLACLILASQEVALDKERKRMREVRPKLRLVEKIHDTFPGRFRWVATVVWLIAVLGGAALAIWINLSRIPWVVACLSAAGA